MTKEEVLKRVEPWVVMAALENFGEVVWQWPWTAWMDFYVRMKKK